VMNPILSSSFRIPLEALEEWEVDKIQKDLLFTIPEDRKYGMGGGGSFRTYEVEGDWLIVPRAYGIRMLKSFPKFKNYVARVSDGEAVDFDFNETLQSTKPAKKKLQDKMVSKVVAAFKAGVSGGVLVAPCGAGKTIIALKIAAKLGVTTTILVHKEFLVNQWLDNINLWLGIPRNDVGIVQQASCPYEGKKVLIAMTQSLSGEREYPPGFYSHSGLVLLDEVHRHSAATWHKAIMKFPARWRLGLTATPTRKDGLWDVVLNSIGEIIAHEDRGWITPMIYRVHYSPYLNVQSYCNCRRRPDGDLIIKKVYLARLKNFLAADERRNQMIVELLKKGAEKGRKTLLLSDRLNQISYLEGAFESATEGKFTVGRYVGGMSEQARAISSRCQVLLGTFQMASEGMDVPDLDALVLASPHADVVQSIGRVLREVDGKKQPLVLDIVDNEPHVCTGFANKRLQTYAQMGWPVRDV